MGDNARFSVFSVTSGGGGGGGRREPDLVLQPTRDGMRVTLGRLAAAANRMKKVVQIDCDFEHEKTSKHPNLTEEDLRILFEALGGKRLPHLESLAIVCSSATEVTPSFVAGLTHFESSSIYLSRYTRLSLEGVNLRGCAFEMKSLAAAIQMHPPTHHVQMQDCLCTPELKPFMETSILDPSASILDIRNLGPEILSVELRANSGKLTEAEKENTKFPEEEDEALDAQKAIIESTTEGLVKDYEFWHLKKPEEQKKIAGKYNMSVPAYEEAAQMYSAHVASNQEASADSATSGTPFYSSDVMVGLRNRKKAPDQRNRGRREERNMDDGFALRTTIASNDNDNNMNNGVYGVDHQEIEAGLDLHPPVAPAVEGLGVHQNEDRFRGDVRHNHDEEQFTRAIEWLTVAILILSIVIACIGLNGFVFAIVFIAPLSDRPVTKIVVLAICFTVGIFGTGFVVAKRVLSALLNKKGRHI